MSMPLRWHRNSTGQVADFPLRRERIWTLVLREYTRQLSPPQARRSTTPSLPTPGYRTPLPKKGNRQLLQWNFYPNVITSTQKCQINRPNQHDSSAFFKPIRRYFPPDTPQSPTPPSTAQGADLPQQQGQVKHTL